MTVRTTPRSLIVVALLAIAVLAAACETAASDQNHMTARANETRRTVGAAALSTDNHLYTGADRWARQMRDDWVNAGCGATRPHLRHSGNLVTFYTPQHAMPGWRIVGENVGVIGVSNDNRAAAMDALHRAYVASPDHYKNIVDRRFTRTGQGVVYGPTVDQLRAGMCPGVRANSVLWSAQVYLG
jgi:uncharacterized protein YkwD